MSASETEFFAEETIIRIVSEVNHAAFRFLSGTFGPLEIGLPCEVPLWLAITLRKKGKCRIEIPEWMKPEYLEAKIAREKSQSEFENMPFHYMEIAQLLLTHAREDIGSPDRVAALLQDFENIRMDRMRSGFISLSQQVNKGDKVVSTQLNNVSAMEILTVKRFLAESLSMLRELSTLNEERERQQTRATLDQSMGNQLEVGAVGGRKLRRFRN